MRVRLTAVLCAVLILVLSVGAFAVRQMTYSSLAVGTGGETIKGSLDLQNSSAVSKWKWNAAGTAGGTIFSATPWTTTGIGCFWDFSTLTSGDAFKIKGLDAKLDGGKYINLYGGTGTTSVWAIGEGGVETYKGGATIDNATSATNLAITETNIGLVGAVTVTGATALNGDVIATDTTGAQFTAKYDAGDYTTITQANTGGVTVDCTSEGTASVTFSDPVWFGAAGSGLYFGAGTSGTAMSNSTVDGTVGKFYTASSATSGDNRGLYWKHDLTGAGASGDAGRFYGVAKAAVANIQGLHATGQIGAAGSVSGEVVGVRATAATSTGLTLSGGSMYALRIDSDLSSAVTGLTTAAMIGIYDVNGTNKMPYFLHFDASATSVIAADTSNLPAAATYKIKCRVGSTDFYLIGVADF